MKLNTFKSAVSIAVLSAVAAGPVTADITDVPPKSISDETDAQKKERLSWWVNDRFGLFIHFGLYAIPARGEWIKTTEQISEDSYDEYFADFNPDLFNAKDWARRAREAGMRYVVLTAKHHEGFCLWDSAFTDYKVTQTPFGRDLFREFVEAFRAEGLRIGVYYSLIDWHHPDFTVDILHPLRHKGTKTWDRMGTADEEYDRLNSGRDMNRYRKYMKDQVTELLTKYGPIDIAWFDFSYGEAGKHTKDWQDWDSVGLVRLVRSICPDIIIDNRLGLRETWGGGDFVTPEQRKVKVWPTQNGKRAYWETCQTFSGSWGYSRDELTWKSPAQLIELLSETVSKGGNLILNVGPTARGEFDERACSSLAKMGKWMRVNSRAIYGCTEAPAEFKVPDNTILTYNPKTRRLYVHLLSYPMGSLPLDFADKVRFARFLHDGSEVRIAKPHHFVHEGDAETVPKGELKLPVVKPDVEIPVVELVLR